MTSLACPLLDTKSARCTKYENRALINNDCIVLSPKNLEEHIDILPSTCSYKLVYEGKDLPDWHPLIKGNLASTVQRGHSVAGRVFSLQDVSEDEYEDYMCDWPI